jgi:hypothetical protein
MPVSRYVNADMFANPWRNVEAAMGLPAAVKDIPNTLGYHSGRLQPTLTAGTHVEPVDSIPLALVPKLVQGFAGVEAGRDEDSEGNGSDADGDSCCEIPHGEHEGVAQSIVVSAVAVPTPVASLSQRSRLVLPPPKHPSATTTERPSLQPTIPYPDGEHAIRSSAPAAPHASLPPRPPQPPSDDTDATESAQPGRFTGPIAGSMFVDVGSRASRRTASYLERVGRYDATRAALDELMGVDRDACD